MKDIYKIEYIDDFYNEAKNNTYYFESKDSEEALNKYINKYGKAFLTKEQIEELKEYYYENNENYIIIETIKIDY